MLISRKPRVRWNFKSEYMAEEAHVRKMKIAFLKLGQGEFGYTIIKIIII